MAAAYVEPYRLLTRNNNWSPEPTSVAEIKGAAGEAIRGMYS